MAELLRRGCAWTLAVIAMTAFFIIITPRRPPPAPCRHPLVALLAGTPAHVACHDGWVTVTYDNGAAFQRAMRLTRLPAPAVWIAFDITEPGRTGVAPLALVRPAAVPRLAAPTRKFGLDGLRKLSNPAVLDGGYWNRRPGPNAPVWHDPLVDAWYGDDGQASCPVAFAVDARIVTTEVPCDDMEVLARPHVTALRNAIRDWVKHYPAPR